LLIYDIDEQLGKMFFIINTGYTRLCRGTHKNLTIPGIYESPPDVNRSKERPSIKNAKV